MRFTSDERKISDAFRAVLSLILISALSVVGLMRARAVSAIGPATNIPNTDTVQSGQNNSALRLVATLPDYKGPSNSVNRGALLSFSPDGRLLAISADGRTIKIFDGQTGQLKATLKGSKEGFDGFAFSSDGRLAATRDILDRSVRLWDTATWESKLTLAGRRKNLESLMKASLLLQPKNYNTISFSPESQTVITEREDDIVDVWDVATGKARAALEHDTHDSGAKNILKSVLTFSPTYFLIMRAKFSPDGRLIATANGDKSPKLWDASTGQLKTTLSENSDRVYFIDFSPDSKAVATGSVNAVVKLWDAETGKLKATLGKSRSNRFRGFKFSPEGRTIAIYLFDDTQLWNVSDGTLRFTLSKSKAKDVAFSPDGMTLATAPEDKRSAAKLWNVETGELKLSLPATEDETSSVAFSPDGRLIVTTHDKGVKVWSTANGDLIATLTEARFPATFSPDGKHLATGGRNETAMLWELSLQR